MNYYFSMNECLCLIKANIKHIILGSVAFALILGGVQAYHYLNNHESQSAAQDNKVENYYSEWKTDKEVMTKEMEKLLIEEYDYVIDHPLLKVSDGTFALKVLSFSFSLKMEQNPDVESWVNQIDSKELFGPNYKAVEAYRGDLIECMEFINDIPSDQSPTQSSDQSSAIWQIKVYDIEEYDVDNVLSVITETIMDNAEKEGILINSHSIVNKTPSSKEVSELREYITNRVTRLQEKIVGLKTSQALSEPVNSQIKVESGLKRVFAFALIGFIFGGCLVILFLVVKTIYSNKVLTTRQIETFLKLVNIGHYDGSKASAHLVDVTICALNGTTNTPNVLCVSNDRNTYINESIHGLCSTEGLKAHYSFGVSGFEDNETLNHIQEIDGIVIPVRLGDTKYSDIENILSWATAIKKNVIGFVEI